MVKNTKFTKKEEPKTPKISEVRRVKVLAQNVMYRGVEYKKGEKAPNGINPKFLC